MIFSNKTMMHSNKIMIIVIFALLLIILSIIILYLNANNDEKIFKPMLDLIAISIITSALFTIIINISSKDYFEKAFHNLILDGLPLLHKLSQIGLVKYVEHYDFSLYEDIYKNDFIESTNVTIVMNDAKYFLEVNDLLFQSRFAQKNKTTNIILLDPEANDSISILTRKNEQVDNHYKDKINHIIHFLIAGQEKYRAHKINVYVHNLFTTMTVVLTDKYAMVGLFRISFHEIKVPHFIFEKKQSDNCEYNIVYNDIEKLKQRSRKIENSNSQ